MKEDHFEYIVIIPIYKDWESLEILISNLRRVMQSNWHLTKLIVVDDFSLSSFPKYLEEYEHNLSVVELIRNVGHQKAITIGLCYAVDRFSNAKNFIIMDSDGEDLPDDIPKLLLALKKSNGQVCFAHRQKRNESTGFKIGYKLYKAFFQILTGKKISFGNFCVTSAEAAKRIVHLSEIWVHFSSGIIKSKIPFMKIPTERGKRYKGNSTMNLTSLITHGLSAISVYNELVAVRITLISILMSIVSGISILVIFFIKQLTILAIPGWASFITIGLLILIAQFFSLGILLTFVILSSKTIKNINPSLTYKEFIYCVH